jgi:hypothetical protein
VVADEKVEYFCEDDRTTQKPGFKFAEWGERSSSSHCVGPKDLENGTLKQKRYFDKRNSFRQYAIVEFLDQIQKICLKALIIEIPILQK